MRVLKINKECKDKYRNWQKKKFKKFRGNASKKYKPFINNYRVLKRITKI